MKASIPGLLLGTVCAGCFNPTGADPPGSTSGSGSVTSGSASTSGDLTSASTSGSSTDASSVTTATMTVAGTTEACTGCCGDGSLDGEEECDDGNLVDDDGCSASCAKEFRRVFVTSMKFSADLGGVEGADEKCKAAAQAAGLPGEFAAWLSTATYSPAAMFVQSSVPYIRVDSEVVAADWMDLIDDDLSWPIDVDENGDTVSGGACDAHPVWTNTWGDGLVYDPMKSCADWQDTSGTTFGGNPELTQGWSDACPFDCSVQASLYCVEQ